jgi:hypothetical protein
MLNARRRSACRNTLGLVAAVAVLLPSPASAAITYATEWGTAGSGDGQFAAP